MYTVEFATSNESLSAAAKQNMREPKIYNFISNVSSFILRHFNYFTHIVPPAKTIKYVNSRQHTPAWELIALLKKISISSLEVNSEQSCTSDIDGSGCSGECMYKESKVENISVS